MDIKKLYADVCISVGEIPLYTFLLYCDSFARMLISKYGSKYAIGAGEYFAPTSLEESFAVADEFYLAALLYIKAEVSGGDLTKSSLAADRAYLTLWRQNAKNKRILKEAW